MNARSKSAGAGGRVVRTRTNPDGADAPSPRTDRTLTVLAWALGAIVAAGLLVMALGPHVVGDYFTETDFYGAYAEGARMIQQGHLSPARYAVVGPVFEVTLAVVGFAVPNLLLAAELIAIAATVATLLLWFHLLRRLADVRIAFAAALFMAANAFFFRYGYAATTDALAIALQAASLFALLTATRMRGAAIAGLLAGLAFLTRYNAVYLLPAGIVVALAGGTRFPARGRAALLVAAGFALPVVPWVIASLASGGSFSFQLHHNLAYEVFARARGIPWDEYQRVMQPEFPTLWDVIRRDPGAVAFRLVANVWDHLRLDAQKLLGWAVAAAAFAGALVGLRDGSLRRLWPVWLAGGLLFGTLLPIFHSERYSLALLPMYAALAGIAFGSPRWALPAGPGKRVWLKPALAVLPLAAALIGSLRVQARTLDQLPVEVLACAETLRAQGEPGDRVIARKPHIAFHGHAEALPFPFVRSLGELADYAREHRARWLYFSWPEAETRPAFYHLLDTTGVVPGLTPRRTTAPHPAVLYEIGDDFGRDPAWFANDTLRTLHDTRGRVMVDGNNAALYYKLGALAWSMGRNADAREPLEIASRLDPGNASVFLLLGGVLLDLGDIARAEAALKRADALAPGDPTARVGLGWAAVHDGRMSDAAALWRPLTTVTRDRATLERMVEVFAGVGDRGAEAEARAALARLGSGP